MRAGMFRLALRQWPAGAAGVALVASGRQYFCLADERRPRFQEVPESLSSQRFQPAVPYPGWDDNWDYCDLSLKQVAKRLSHAWPIVDFAAAIRKLYAEHSDKSESQVDKLLEDNKDDLPGLYKRTFLKYAFGGGVTRHIILVRHGQYDEQSKLAKKLHAESPHTFGLPGDTKYAELDRARVLTELGRQQAEKTGKRLAELLEPALHTPGREDHVRIHNSTLTRAVETADIIAAQLPAHVRRCPADPNLVEGEPPAHIIPYRDRGGEEFLEKRSRDVHIEGARMEAAFRSFFYRDVPCKKGGAAPASASSGSRDESESGSSAAKGDTTGSKSSKSQLPRHEYDVVVCHMNLIRYFTLRALQLPPEAWLRLGGFNGSIVHLKIRPSGNVSLVCFGDAGHLSLKETTFGKTVGLEG